MEVAFFEGLRSRREGGFCGPKAPFQVVIAEIVGDSA